MKKKVVQIKAVCTNICGSGGNLIYPPIICPGETARWSCVFFCKLLSFRRDALLEANCYSQEKQYPILVTSDCLSGIKDSYLKACELFSNNGLTLCKEITFFSKDMFHHFQNCRLKVDEKHLDFTMYFTDYTVFLVFLLFGFIDRVNS